MRPGWGGFWEAVENGLWIPLWARDVEWRGSQTFPEGKGVETRVYMRDTSTPHVSQTFPEGKGVETSASSSVSQGSASLSQTFPEGKGVETLFP